MLSKIDSDDQGWRLYRRRDAGHQAAANHLSKTLYIITKPNNVQIRRYVNWSTIRKVWWQKTGRDIKRCRRVPRPKVLEQAE